MKYRYQIIEDFEISSFNLFHLKKKKRLCRSSDDFTEMRGRVKSVIREFQMAVIMRKDWMGNLLNTVSRHAS